MPLQLNTEAVGLEQSVQSIVNRINRRGLSVRIKASEFTQPLGRITQKADEFTKSLEASNARVIAFGASAVIIGSVAKGFEQLVVQAVKFEKLMTDINVVLGTTSSNLAKFGTELFNVARNTSQALDVAAEAALEFSRQGLSMEETLRRTNDALILTRLTGIDAASAVSGLTAAVNGFADAGLSTTSIINKLAAVDVKFAVSAEDLINALARSGAVAQDAGVSFDQLVGAVTSAQQITARGGAVIGNSFKTIFTRIQRSSTLDRLEELGVAVRDVQGATLPALTVLSNLAREYDKLSSSTKAAVAEQVGGVFQINVLKAALKDLNRENSLYAQATQISNNATDQAQQKNAQLQQTLSSLATQTSLTIQELSANLGELALSPGLSKLLDSLNSFGEGLNNLFGKDSEGLGADFAKGIVKGFGNVLMGPGLVLAFGIFAKLFANAFKFAKSSLKDVLGIVTAKDKERAIQESIVVAMEQNKQLAIELQKYSHDKVKQEQIMLELIEQQTSHMLTQQKIASTLAPGLAKRGVRPDLTSEPKKSRSGLAASGFVPNFSSVSKSERDTERKSAIKAGYSPGAVKDMKIQGLGRVIYNNAEKVKKFPGMKQQAIMPPRDSQAGEKYQERFQEKHGFNPYKATGMVPNFVDWSKVQTISKGGRGITAGEQLAAQKLLSKKGVMNINTLREHWKDEPVIRHYLKSNIDGEPASMYIDMLKSQGYNKESLNQIKKMWSSYQNNGLVSINGIPVKGEGLIPNFALEATRQGDKLILPKAKMIVETSAQDRESGWTEKIKGYRQYSSPVSILMKEMPKYRDTLDQLQKLGINHIQRGFYFTNLDKQNKAGRAATRAFKSTKDKNKQGEAFEKALHQDKNSPLVNKKYKSTQAKPDAKVDAIAPGRMPMEYKAGGTPQKNSLISKSIRLYNDKYIEKFLEKHGNPLVAQEFSNKKLEDSLVVAQKVWNKSATVDDVKMLGLSTGLVPNFLKAINQDVLKKDKMKKNFDKGRKYEQKVGDVFGKRPGWNSPIDFYGPLMAKDKTKIGQGSKKIAHQTLSFDYVDAHAGMGHTAAQLWRKFWNAGIIGEDDIADFHGSGIAGDQFKGKPIDLTDVFTEVVGLGKEGVHQKAHKGIPFTFKKDVFIPTAFAGLIPNFSKQIFAKRSFAYDYSGKKNFYTKLGGNTRDLGNFIKWLKSNKKLTTYQIKKIEEDYLAMKKGYETSYREDYNAVKSGTASQSTVRNMYGTRATKGAPIPGDESMGINITNPETKVFIKKDKMNSLIDEWKGNYSSNGFIPNYSISSFLGKVKNKLSTIVSQKYTKFAETWNQLGNARNRQKYLIDLGLTNKAEALEVARMQPNQALRYLKSNQSKIESEKIKRGVNERINKASATEPGDYVVGRQRWKTGHSLGLVPNFSNPLSDAIGRERSAGIPASMIRVDQDSTLKSKDNPMGLAVINTRDEPGGVKQGINRAKKMGIDPKTHGASSGLIPNFASKNHKNAGEELKNMEEGESRAREFNLSSGLIPNFASKNQKDSQPSSSGDMNEASGGLMMGLFALTSASYALEGALADSTSAAAGYTKMANSVVMGLSQSIMVYDGLNQVAKTQLEKGTAMGKFLGGAAKGLGVLGAAIGFAVPVFQSIKENTTFLDNSFDKLGKSINKTSKGLDVLGTALSQAQDLETSKNELTELNNSTLANTFDGAMKRLNLEVKIAKQQGALSKSAEGLSKELNLSTEEIELMTSGTSQGMQKLQEAQLQYAQKLNAIQIAQSLAGSRDENNRGFGSMALDFLKAANPFGSLTDEGARARRAFTEDIGFNDRTDATITRDENSLMASRISAARSLGGTAESNAASRDILNIGSVSDSDTYIKQLEANIKQALSSGDSTKESAAIQINELLSGFKDSDTESTRLEGIGNLRGINDLLSKYKSTVEAEEKVRQDGLALNKSINEMLQAVKNKLEREALLSEQSIALDQANLDLKKQRNSLFASSINKLDFLDPDYRQDQINSKTKDATIGSNLSDQTIRGKEFERKRALSTQDFIKQNFETQVKGKELFQELIPQADNQSSSSKAKPPPNSQAQQNSDQASVSATSQASADNRIKGIEQQEIPPKVDQTKTAPERTAKHKAFDLINAVSPVTALIDPGKAAAARQRTAQDLSSAFTPAKVDQTKSAAGNPWQFYPGSNWGSSIGKKTQPLARERVSNFQDNTSTRESNNDLQILSQSLASEMPIPVEQPAPPTESTKTAKTTDTSSTDSQTDSKTSTEPDNVGMTKIIERLKKAKLDDLVSTLEGVKNQKLANAELYKYLQNISGTANAYDLMLAAVTAIAPENKELLTSIKHQQQLQSDANKHRKDINKIEEDKAEISKQQANLSADGVKASQQSQKTSSDLQKTEEDRIKYEQAIRDGLILQESKALAESGITDQRLKIGYDTINTLNKNAEYQDGLVKILELENYREYESLVKQGQRIAAQQKLKTLTDKLIENAAQQVRNDRDQQGLNRIKSKASTEAKSEVNPDTGRNFYQETSLTSLQDLSNAAIEAREQFNANTEAGVRFQQTLNAMEQEGRDFVASMEDLQTRINSNDFFNKGMQQAQKNQLQSKGNLQQAQGELAYHQGQGNEIMAARSAVEVANAQKEYNIQMNNGTLFMDSMAVKIAEANERIANFRETLAGTMFDGVRDGIKTMFQDMISGTKSTKEAFMGLLHSVVSKINDKMMDNAADKMTAGVMSLLNPIMGGAMGERRNSGGLIGGGVQRYARGGSTRQVPAMLTAGEYVVRKKIVDKLGTKDLSKINESGSLEDLYNKPNEEIFDVSSDSSSVIPPIMRFEDGGKIESYIRSRSTPEDKVSKNERSVFDGDQIINDFTNTLQKFTGGIVKHFRDGGFVKSMTQIAEGGAYFAGQMAASDPDKPEDKSKPPEPPKHQMINTRSALDLNSTTANMSAQFKANDKFHQDYNQYLKEGYDYAVQKNNEAVQAKVDTYMPYANLLGMAAGAGLGSAAGKGLGKLAEVSGLKEGVGNLSKSVGKFADKISSKFKSKEKTGQTSFTPNDGYVRGVQQMKAEMDANPALAKSMNSWMKNNPNDPISQHYTYMNTSQKQVKNLNRGGVVDGSYYSFYKDQNSASAFNQFNNDNGSSKQMNSNYNSNSRSSSLINTQSYFSEENRQSAFNQTINKPQHNQGNRYNDQIFNNSYNNQTRYMSGGGKVYGPGGVDKVGPIMLDKGEYVIKASSVNRVEKQYPGFFERLNSMKMNQGGIVEPSKAPMPATTTEQKSSSESGGNVTININVSASGDTTVEGGGESGQKQLASQIKDAVIGVISQEKRVGGMLRGKK